MVNTDWEARYQEGNTPWEKGYASPPLVDWLSRNAMPGKVLVPGCGSGHDVRAIARTAATVIGLDVAPSAINIADSQPRAGNERYRLADLFQLPAELVGQFDWVFEHTCFCAIDPRKRRDYVEAVAAALVPGGRMLAVFYLDTGNPEGEGPPFGTSRPELDGLFGQVFNVIEEYVPEVAYPGREGCELLRVLQLRNG